MSKPKRRECPFVSEDGCWARQGKCSFPDETPRPKNCSIRVACTPLLAAMRDWCNLYATWGRAGHCARRLEVQNTELRARIAALEAAR